MGAASEFASACVGLSIQETLNRLTIGLKNIPGRDADRECDCVAGSRFIFLNEAPRYAYLTDVKVVLPQKHTGIWLIPAVSVDDDVDVLFPHVFWDRVFDELKLHPAVSKRFDDVIESPATKDAFAFEVHDVFAGAGEGEDFAEDFTLVTGAVVKWRTPNEDDRDFDNGDEGEEGGLLGDFTNGFHSTEEERSEGEECYGVEGEVILAGFQSPKTVKGGVVKSGEQEEEDMADR